MARSCPLVAVVQTTFPASLDYPEARGVRLLRDRGDTDVVVLQRRDTGRARSDGLAVETHESLVGLLGRLARTRPDLVVVHGTGPVLAALPTGRRSWSRSPIRSPRASRAAGQELLLARADVVSFQNPWERTRWRTRRPREVDLPAPVDTRWFAEPVARDPALWTDRGMAVPEGPVLAYVANVVPVKRHAELVAWLAPLLHERPDVVLALAGALVDRPSVERLVAAIDAAGLGDRIHVMRRLPPEDVRVLWAWADLHVLSTASETQCMALYEGLAAGVPAVLPDVPSLTMAFPHLPVHHDATELRAHVDAVLDDPDRARTLVDASADRVAWADVERHDRLFLATIDDLVS